MEICDDYDHLDQNITYILESIATKGTEDAFNEEFRDGCSCNEKCDEKHCSCIIKSGAFYAQSNSALILKVKNKEQPVYECNDSCKCMVRNCGNRLVQNGPIQNLEIINSGVKGLGLRTNKEIPKGTFICEYAGEIITPEESVKRHTENERTNAMNYIFSIREHFGDVLIQTVVDPSKFGNIGRYLNHSCNPNCEILTIRTNTTVPKICIFSRVDVKTNQELTFDYGQDSLEVTDDAETEKKPCLCGEENCRKYMPFQI